MLRKKLPFLVALLLFAAHISACRNGSDQAGNSLASANPTGATARCSDGTLSYSQHHQGTCSHHGGVAEWLPIQSATTVPLETPSPSQTPTIQPAPSPVATTPEANPADLFVDESAGGWTPIERTEYLIFYYNPSRTSNLQNGLFKTWIKEALKPPIKSSRDKFLKDRERGGSKTSGYEVFRQSLDLYELNCRDSTIRVTSSTDYDYLGTVLGSYQAGYARWEDAVPESVGETILRTVCHPYSEQSTPSQPVRSRLTENNSTPSATAQPSETEQKVSTPPGASAICRDGTYSFSQSRSGTCSHHGGVARWL